MGNKRISELNSLYWNTVSGSDLLVIADVSVPETKNISIDDISTFVLNNGSITASLHGTASYANVSLYALNAPASTQVSYATSSLSSSFSSASFNATTSSYAITASISTSSSYATMAGSLANTFILNANTADSASYIRYSGTPNGTSSYSISSSYSVSSSFSAISLNSTYASQAISVVGIRQQIPVYATYTSASLIGSVGTIALTFNLPVGYSTWNEFDLKLQFLASSADGNGGQVTSSFSYSGSGSPVGISSTQGSGNSGVGYLGVNNSGDSVIYTWFHNGIINNTYQSTSPLILSASYLTNGGTMNFRNLTYTGKIYALK